MDLIFLGTGGGRFVTYTQRRWTGGIRIIQEDFHLHIDPGPGTIVRCADTKLSPEKVGLLLISHAHLDHYRDAEIFIEGMTRGTTRKSGKLIAPRSVLRGGEKIERPISKYHQTLLQNIIEVHPGDINKIGDIIIRVTRAIHNEADAVGFVIEVSKVGAVGYTSDTEIFEEMADLYRDLTLLILCVMRPKGAQLPGHLSIDDANKIVTFARPKIAILTHFGMRMIDSNPQAQAAYIQNSTGTPTLAAFDGMSICVDNDMIFSWAC